MLTMASTSLSRPNWRMLLAAALAVATLTAGCGGDDASETSGDTPTEAGTSTLAEFQDAARSVCAVIDSDISADPGQYDTAADGLAALPLPADETEAATASALVDGLEQVTVTFRALTAAISEFMPDFESPPGTWFLVEDGTLYASQTGGFGDVEATDVPTEIGKAFVDAKKQLNEAAGAAAVTECVVQEQQQ